MVPVISYNGAAIATIIAELVELVLLLVISKELIDLKMLSKKFLIYLAESLSIVAVWLIFYLTKTDIYLGAGLVVFASVIIYAVIQYKMKNKFVNMMLEKIKIHRR